jgi:hypothetical protein
MTGTAMLKWGGILAKDMTTSAMNAGLTDFTGALLSDGIRYEHRPRTGTGFLFMRLYGVYQDSMRPHRVYVTRRRTRLLAWARMKGNAEIQAKVARLEARKITRFPIFVRPHPFIAQGYRTARPKLRPLLARMAKRWLAAA